MTEFMMLIILHPVFLLLNAIFLTGWVIWIARDLFKKKD